MQRPIHHRWRVGAGLVALAGTLAIALTMPIPSVPDVGRAAVSAQVQERLPGWSLQRVDPSWEGGYTIVASCAGLELDFQYVPGHGLPADDAWIHPSDAYARQRLDELSDHRRYLIWRHDPARVRTLSCADELARTGDPVGREQPLD